MDWQGFAAQMGNALAPLFWGMVTWIGAEAGRWFRSKAKVNKSQAASVLMTRLEQGVKVIVKRLEQTTVQALKKASEDGKLSREDAKRVRDLAIEQARSYFGPEGLRQMARDFGMTGDGLMDFIADMVEAAVYDLRH